MWPSRYRSICHHGPRSVPPLRWRYPEAQPGWWILSNSWRGHAQTHTHTHNSVVSRRERITVGPKTVTNHRRHRELQSSSCHILKPMYLWIPIVFSRTEIKPSMTQTNPITCMLVAQLDILFCLLESIVWRCEDEYLWHFSIHIFPQQRLLCGLQP